MHFEAVRHFFLSKLERDLPQHLTYHSIHHVYDVLGACQSIAEMEQITGDHLLILQTAALLHDAGFTIQSQGHEDFSCKIAQSTLPAFGYRNDQISQICEIIMATRIPQQPQSHLGEILADADLDYLGRDDFFVISDLLFEEMKYSGIVKEKNEWNLLQLRFFEQHHYFTKTSIHLRSAKKQEHYNYIKSMIE